MIEPVVIRIRANISSTSAMEAQSKCAWLFQYLYYLTKTRGYKTVGRFWKSHSLKDVYIYWLRDPVKFMTHEVSDLEPMVDFMNAQEIKDGTCWETRYVCLIWLSIICMVPFDLRKIDSGLVASGQQSLINRLLDIHKRYLGCTGKERDASSILVARLLSRWVWRRCHPYSIEIDSPVQIADVTYQPNISSLIFNGQRRNFPLPRTFSRYAIWISPVA